MSAAHLGETIDIHCGGQDLIFPHHENEIAQSEAAYGVPLARYWMHNGFLRVDNKKMSKSLGNFFTVRDAAAVYGYETIRLFMLSAHYRNPLNYSTEALEQNRAALTRLYTTNDHLAFLMRQPRLEAVTPEEAAFAGRLKGYAARFERALDDDLNTADAVGVLFEAVREINTCTAERTSRALAEVCAEALHGMTDVLGLLEPGEEVLLDADIETMIRVRQEARASKNFAEADRIRDELRARGVLLEDTPQGVKWKRGKS
jgi:cysteinyl-tRNA synthetase